MLFLFLFYAFGVSQIQAKEMNQELASRVVKLSLDCVDKELPHMEKKSAKKEHPSFFGCYDWHSSVHGHWAMLRILSKFDLPEKQSIIKKLTQHLERKKIKTEIKNLKRISSFEIPYGYGWFLRLSEEVERSSLPEAKKWRKAIRPLEQKIVRELSKYLKRSTPVRVGTHDNTAFAMTHAWDYALAVKNNKFQRMLRKRALAFYGKDEKCALDKEPQGTDFISPCFIEADLMRRILAPKDFELWFNRFIPALSEEQLKPVIPSDPKDYQIGHLIGLMFQKASSLRAVGEALSSENAMREKLLHAAKLQAEEGWKWIFQSGYGGEHWLASFAIFYET